MTTALRILVDADACPVKDEVYKVAWRHEVPVTLVSNQHLRIPEHPLVDKIVVGAGFDAADDWIAEASGAWTVVVTADILLADRCIKAGATVISNAGKPFTANSIGAAVATRAIMADLRAAPTAGGIGGPAPFSKADRSRFLSSLDEAIVRLSGLTAKVAAVQPALYVTSRMTFSPRGSSSPMFRRFGLLAAPLALLLSASAPPNPYTDTSPGDNWPGFGRTYGEQHYSPLDQIDRATVGRLGLVWSYDLPPGNPLSGPVEAGGMLYTATGYSVVRAFDVATGRLLWEHDTHSAEQAGPRMRYAWGVRGLAWWRDRIYVGTVEGRLIALDGRTGKQLWVRQTLEPGMIANLTGAPRIFDGKVITGFGGADYAKVRGYVTAYDAITGRKLWRFYTVPGNPAVDKDETTRIAAKSWSGEWWKYGGGGTAWNAFSYDPATQTVFVGTGNGGPWNHRIRSEGKGDNLFVCSIVALDAKTGRYKWHYQFNPAETWDYNAVMDMELADLTIGGKRRQVVMTAPKNGFFYVIDRITGKLISAEPFAKVTWATRIDIATGRPVEIPAARFPNGSQYELWPSLEGAHNWLPMAYSPKTKLVYLPTLDMPARYDDRGINYKTWKWDPGGRNDVGVNPGLFTPDLLRDASASLQAWDPVKQKAVWTLPAFGLWSGSTLATGGGIVFNGQADGQFRAIDDRSGRILWSFDGTAPMIGPPITYRWKGRQYVSIIAGYGVSMAVYDVTRKVGEDFATQGRRVLTFALDGKAALPPRPARAEVVPPPDPDFVPDKKKWLAGVVAYHQQCTICHGVFAIGVGSAPDLRGSAVPLSAEAFRTIVHGGALAAAGMPRFTQLGDDEIEAIRFYIRSRARDLAEGK